MAGERWIRYFEPRGDRNGARGRAGDIFFARITPCLENGKVAQVPPTVERCGGSTEFIVLRAGPELDPDYLYCWASSDTTRERAEALMSGTTGRQRVSSNDLSALPVPIPPREDQSRIAEVILAANAVGAEAQKETICVMELRTVLLGSTLSGEHSIAASYDAFLKAVG